MAAQRARIGGIVVNEMDRCGPCSLEGQSYAKLHILILSGCQSGVSFAFLTYDFKEAEKSFDGASDEGTRSDTHPTALRAL